MLEKPKSCLLIEVPLHVETGLWAETSPRRFELVNETVIGLFCGGAESRAASQAPGNFHGSSIFSIYSTPVIALQRHIRYSLLYRHLTSDSPACNSRHSNAWSCPRLRTCTSTCDRARSVWPFSGEARQLTQILPLANNSEPHRVYRSWSW